MIFKKPNFLIILRNGQKYIDRWYLIPQNRFFNIYLHRLRADDNQVLHDHPWNNLSIILKGGYFETHPIPRSRCTKVFHGEKETVWYGPGSFIFRKAHYPHRLSLKRIDKPLPLYPGVFLSEKQECWSLFITGPVTRWVFKNGKRYTNWGFHTRQGWITHARLVKMENGVSQITPEGEELMK